MNLKRVELWSALVVVLVVHSALLINSPAMQYAALQNLESERNLTVKFLLSQPSLDTEHLQRSSLNHIPHRGQPESPDQHLASGLQQAVQSDATWLGTKYYFSRDQIDEPTLPLADWQIQTGIVPPDSLSNLVFTVWVDDRGSITKWKIEDQSPEGDWAKSLLSQIAETKMQSAVLNGQHVASIATFEIGFDTRVFR